VKRTHQLFVPFSKTEKQDDGTLKVYGVASTESEDSDGEIVKADAMRAALPDYLTFGAVREMHQPIAAGTAIAAEVTKDGVTQFTALVVDPVSVKKVETGVLKGFSIGGRVTKRNATSKNIIEALKLTEISLVDRPANPDAVITLVKFGKDGSALVDGGATLRKGMYEVCRLADLVGSLSYLTLNAKNEAMYEGDGSTMGAKLHGACENLVGILKEMVDEETAELLGLTSDDVATMAAKAAEHGYAGRMAKLSEQLDALKGANLNGGTTTMKTGTEGGAPAPSDELVKAQTDLKAASDELVKVTGERDELRKRAEKAEGDLAKANGQLTELATETGKLVESLTAKGHLRAVPKTGDNGGEGETEAQKAERARLEKDPVNLIKSAFARPIVMGPGGTQKAAH
jgi:hypothetical protein